jgi:hypothetical protein
MARNAAAASASAVLLLVVVAQLASVVPPAAAAGRALAGGKVYVATSQVVIPAGNDDVYGSYAGGVDLGGEALGSGDLSYTGSADLTVDSGTVWHTIDTANVVVNAP